MNLDNELFKLVGQKQKMAFQIYFNADSTISHFIVTCSRNGNSVCDLFSKFDELRVYGFLLEYMKLYHGSFPLAKVEDSDKLFTIFQTPKNETELLRILSEIYYNQQTKNVKNIYSFVGSLVSYDFEARVYDPAVGRFTAPDPLAWDTPWLSPYSYCAANPVNLIDPTGNYWIKAKYDKTSFYYYDSRILTEDDIAKYYGDETDLSFAGQSITIEVLDAETRKMLDSFKLKDDGTFLMNGTELDTEYKRNNSLIIGSDCFLAKDKNGNIVYPNNWYGNYLGPNNPMTGTSQYIYAVPPIDRLDYAAFNHDRNYDKQGAVSYIGVINPLTLKADSQLAFEAFVSNPSRFEGKIMSELTYRVFLSLSMIKTISLGAIPGIGPLLINYSLSH